MTKSGHDICPIFYAFFKYIFSFRFTSGGSSWYEAHATRPPCFYPLHSRTTEAGCKSGKVQPSNITTIIITTWSNLMYLSVLLRRFIQADTPAHKSAEKYTLQHQFHVLVCNPTVKARNVATKHLFLKEGYRIFFFFFHRSRWNTGKTGSLRVKIVMISEEPNARRRKIRF